MSPLRSTIERLRRSALATRSHDHDRGNCGQPSIGKIQIDGGPILVGSKPALNYSRGKLRSSFGQSKPLPLALSGLRDAVSPVW